MNSVAVITDPLYLEHNMGPHHPESPDRLRVLYKMLRESPVGQKVKRLSPRLATHDELQWVHSPAHIQHLADTKGRSVPLDPDTSTAPRSYETALLATGGLLVGIEAVMEMEADQAPSWNLRTPGAPEVHCAFALIRPPGHHAERDHVMGFCLFNNIAVGAEYLIKRHGLQKILIVDYDVHHGNGTQHVFFISLHRYPFYPGTGSAREEGEGPGRGYTRNIPFSGGQGDEEYLRAFEDTIVPLALDYGPDFILVSAGYDAHERDPLGGMNVTAQGFAAMTQKILEVAKKKCRGRLVLSLEGGYDLQGLRESVEACLGVLAP